MAEKSTFFIIKEVHNSVSFIPDKKFWSDRKVHVICSLIEGFFSDLARLFHVPIFIWIIEKKKQVVGKRKM